LKSLGYFTIKRKGKLELGASKSKFFLMVKVVVPTSRVPQK
jgi:hypothetical protein